MTATPVWAQLAYLFAAVCFILALKGLSSPKHARTGNLIGAVGAVVACVVVFFYAELDHVVPILIAIAIGTAVGFVGAQRVQMTQMPQLVALFNGVGGGAAALVALLELADRRRRRPAVAKFTLAATAFTILVGAVSLRRLAGHLRQAAGADDLAAGGLPRPAVAVRRARCSARSRWSVVLVARPGDVGRRRARPRRPAARRPPGAAGRRRRRADRDLAAQRVHRPDRRRRRLRARQHPAAGRRHAGRRVRHAPDPADGRARWAARSANILFGALKGGSTLGGGEASDRPVRSAGPEDVAILLGYAAPGDHRARATGSPSRRPSTRCASSSTC